MKTLVIVAHPNLAESRINNRLARAVEDTQGVTVHHLYNEYPDFNIDVEREQKLLLEHDRIVLQFPFYWYSSPALLKQWEDAVLAYGFAYGHEGTALHGKEFMLALSTGGPEEAYQAGGYNQYSMSELLKPFQATSNLIGTKYLPPFLIHGIFQVSDEQLEQLANEYTAYVQAEFAAR